MTEPSPLKQETLDRLQRLRLSVLAFHDEIAPLPATGKNNARNQQYNHLRLEAAALLKTDDFDKRVPQAVTDDVLAERTQKTIIPRLSIIVIFGVMLALFGLGINSIILDDFVINSIGCLISTGGMMLIMGAFAVLGLTQVRQQRITNLGDLYQYGNILLLEINHALNMDIPAGTDRARSNIPQIPSAIELMLDSLNKQAGDWQQKLRALEQQRISAGPNTPLELTVNIDFVQRELNRVKKEIDCLQGQGEVEVEQFPPPPASATDPDSVETTRP
jgi:hypothetical protein